MSFGSVQYASQILSVIRQSIEDKNLQIAFPAPILCSLMRLVISNHLIRRSN